MSPWHDSHTRAEAGEKKRPVVVIQDDIYNQKLRHVIVAEVTSNPGLSSDPASLTVQIDTNDGKATGLLQDSAITCLHLVTMSEDRIGKVIGKLSVSMLESLDGCLKVALGLKG